MSNLQIIEKLSKIAKEQNMSIKELSNKLSELDAIREYEERIEKSHQEYIDILGADEF